MSRTFDPRQSNPLNGHAVSEALRAEGFVPLPRLWVKKENMPKIHEITQQHAHQVNAIRNKVRQEQGETQADPRTDKDAAWQALERMKGSE